MPNANMGVVDAVAQYIGVRGDRRDPLGLFIPQNNYAALCYIPLDTACQDKAIGGQGLDNADNV